MTDISPTASGVENNSSGNTNTALAGETLTQGQPVYEKTAGVMWKTDSSELASAAAAGITLNAASAGQPINYQKSGSIDLGATVLTVGEVYCVSTTAGGIAPDEDVTTGLYRTVLGVAITTRDLMIRIQVSGVAIPA